MGRFVSFPPMPEVPEPVRGSWFVIVDAYHAEDRAQADELLAPLRALAPWAAQHMYLNFADARRDAANFWPTATYERLRRIKAAVDLGDVIRSNHPVAPLV